ncbi:MAG: dehydrogenase [Bacteroidetes bacterium]|nr:MAG: dehydrogenase [Bacteroidota bacterium]
MPELAHACWHLDAQTSAIQPEPLPDLTAGQLRLRARYSLISAGTERLVARGEVPAEIAGDMGVPFMGGAFPFPIKYGYSLVAEIEAPAPQAGQLVHLLHPHQDRLQVPAGAVFPVPAGVPARRAVLASNLETALNALWDSGLSLGDRALVVGYGLIGALVARLLQRLPAVEVVVQEPDAHRRALAEAQGLAVQAGPGAQRFDYAFHTSASAGGLQAAIDQTAFEGTIVEMSWYGTRSVPVALGGSFHSQRKRLISSQVSQLPAGRRGRWDYRRRKAAVFALLQDSAFDALLTDEVPFAGLPDFFQNLRQGTAGGFAWTVRYA